ncbi:hypothetical protein ES703_13127 [subsurface metagenome]
MWYEHILPNEPKYVQIAVAATCKELYKKYKDHWLRIVVQGNGYYIVIVDLGMPVTSPCAVYSVFPQEGGGKPEVVKIF